MKRILKGVYEGSDVRAERAGRGWRAWVKLRRIGETPFYEYSSRGLWCDIGVYPTLAAVQDARDALAAGTHVLRPGHYDNLLGHLPPTLRPWTEVAEEIAAHPSVCPPGP